MKLVVLFGPQAVGKMTVGQELCRITDLNLFHNHMTIDVVSKLFEHDPKERHRLTDMFRNEIFESYSKSDAYGMIFTFVWAFDHQSDWEFIEKLEKLFLSRGAEVYFVELEANYDLRLERNKTENRLLHKSTKRDLEWSESIFVKLESKYRLNSYEGEVSKDKYIRINNSNLSPEKVASKIKEAFNL